MERKRLEDFASPTPSRWRENAIYRLENSRWLRRSQKIAMEMLDRMDFWESIRKNLPKEWDVPLNMFPRFLKEKRIYPWRQFVRLRMPWIWSSNLSRFLRWYHYNMKT